MKDNGARADNAATLYAIARTGLHGTSAGTDSDKRACTRFLPGNIYDTIRNFKTARFSQELLGSDVHDKYATLKQVQADR